MFLGDKLEAFILVVEEKSLAGAARKLRISSAAMTKRVQELENALGMQLLTRTTRRIELTESGHLCYEHAKIMKGHWENFFSLFSELRNEPSGTLKVGGSKYFIQKYIAPDLTAFLEKYPKVELVFEIHERFIDLVKDGLDINLGHGTPGADNEIVRRIGTTQYIFVASPKYLERFGKPKRPEDLKKGHRLIEHSMRPKVNSFDKGLEIVIEPYVLVNDSLTMKHLAMEGIGITKIHRYVAERELKEGLLVEVLKGCDTKEQPLYINYMPYRHLQSKIRAFLDFFLPKMPVDTF